MKDKNRSVRQRVEDFLTGRGFYIALSACVLVIGIAAWTLLTAGNIADRTDVADADSATAGIVDSDGLQEVARPKPEKIQKIEDELEDKDNEPEAETIIPEAPDEDAVETIAPPETEPVQEVSEPLTFGWPVFGEVEVGYFADELVYNKTMLDWRTHSAIDIAADLGTKVMACARGTVTKIYEDALMGTIVVVDHGDGLESIYANLAATPNVNVGDEVGLSTVIGAVGDTAIGETGQPYHLHFAMKQDGESVDPTEYLP